MLKATIKQHAGVSPCFRTGTLSVKTQIAAQVRGGGLVSYPFRRSRGHLPGDLVITARPQHCDPSRPLCNMQPTAIRRKVPFARAAPVPYS